MNVGILGAGRIAIKMAQTINQLEGFTNYAIASRSTDKANKFKEEYGCLNAYGSYNDLVNDDNVDLIYIATPHSTHFEYMKLCIKHHKNILCEKAFTLNYKEAKETVELAKKEHVYLAEALWTSYMPSKNLINETIKSYLGEINSIKAVFKVNVMSKERIYKKELGGGALLDLGVYPISMIIRILGKNYDSINVNKIEYGPTGVDIKEELTFNYGNIKAVCISDATEDRESYVEINGTNGKMFIEYVQCPEYINIYDNNDSLVKTLSCKPLFGGFEYELLYAKEAIENNQIENKKWTLDDTLFLMKVLDEIRNETK